MYTAKLAERSNWKRRLNFVETYWKQLAVEANRAGKSENECATIFPGPESHTYIQCGFATLFPYTFNAVL
jgi:hypothetical protein